jgi:hypothetical protein
MPGAERAAQAVEPGVVTAKSQPDKEAASPLARDPASSTGARFAHLWITSRAA